MINTLPLLGAGKKEIGRCVITEVLQVQSVCVRKKRNMYINGWGVGVGFGGRG